MNCTIIKDRLYYIGVNDRTTQKFESMWELPQGVSYNSYLVCGSDKTAVIDGVEISHASEQIATIRGILGDRTPDYLIINHMEPDHSGGIELLRQAFPGITIVGNNVTLSMVEGYHGIKEGTLAVKDGSTLDLGGVTLRFTLTPLVHWPETMMTYMEEEGVLFSGDAFGCFGALNGAVVDTMMDTSRYFPEMVRYYSNIVGKYGVFVQRALKKLAGTDLRYLCPTHGPVWHEELQRVVALYDTLSRYEPLDNGVTIVYGSMYGNTERLVEKAAETLAAAGVKNIAVHNASYSPLSDILADVFRHKGLIVAAPTYSENLFPPIAAFMEALVIRGIKNREIALMGSHTWVHHATKVMKQHLDTLGIEPVDEPLMSKQRPTEDALARCAEIASRLAEKL